MATIILARTTAQKVHIPKIIPITTSIELPYPHHIPVTPLLAL